MATNWDQLKAAVNYRTAHNMCGGCKHYTSEMLAPAWMKNAGYSEIYMQKVANEKNMRCTLHNFAVKKTAVCNSWEAKP